MRRVFRWTRPILGLLITSLFVWLTIRQLDIERIIASAAQIRFAPIIVALLALCAGYSFRIVRWWWMLRSSDASVELRACVWPLLTGVAVNNVVPLRAGDILRVVAFRDQLRSSAVRLIGTLLVERLLDATVLLLILLAGIADLGPGVVPAAYLRIATAVAVAALGAWTVIALFGGQLESLLTRLCRHRSLARRNWDGPAARHVQQLFAALNIVRAPRRLVELMGASVLIWTCEGIVFAAIASGLAYRGPAFGPWFALATGTLATLIPSSPGYVGTFDFFAMSGLIAYGASRSVAAAFALIVHIVLWLPLTAAGVTYLLLPKSTEKRQRAATAFARTEERT